MNLPFLSSAPLHLLATGSLLVVLLLFFMLGFGLPAWRQSGLLKKVLQAIEGKDLRDSIDPQALDKAFPKDGEVAHLWREYKKTLYAVSGESTDGVVAKPP